MDLPWFALEREELERKPIILQSLFFKMAKFSNAGKAFSKEEKDASGNAAVPADTIAANHYMKLSVQAEACIHCGHCERRGSFV